MCCIRKPCFYPNIIFSGAGNFAQKEHMELQVHFAGTGLQIIIWLLVSEIMQIYDQIKNNNNNLKETSIPFSFSKLVEI
jgi:hypothetical protein